MKKSNLKVISKTNKTTTGSTLKIGSKVSGKFVSSFEPIPFVGMKYTFISTMKGSNYNLPPKEESTEVTEITTNGYAKLFISGSNQEDREKVIRVSEIRSSGIIYVDFKYEGLKDIKVPFGSFKNATKVSVSNKSTSLSLWLVKNIGVVKLVECDKVSHTTVTTELEEFRTKKNSFDDKSMKKIY